MLIRLGASIVFIYIMSCRFYLRKRALFRLYHLIDREKARIEDTLQDLLPPDLVRKKMQHISEVAGDNAISHGTWSLSHDICPCQHRLAVVLQLDMCNFTMLSQKLGACGIAALMHQLFSAFDTHLLSLNGSILFKMDTIGDAYVAAAFIDPEAKGWRLSDASDGAHRAALFASPHAKQAYASILWLAGMMLETVRRKRESSGLPLHCRIGVGAGGVLAGAMGWLQPRFHLRGPAMELAELAERSAAVDSANVPCCVLRAMHGDSPADAPRVGTQPPVRRRMVDSGLARPDIARQAQEVVQGGEVGIAAFAPTGWKVSKVVQHPSCRMSALWMCSHEKCGCSAAGVGQIEKGSWTSCCMTAGSLEE